MAERTVVPVEKFVEAVFAEAEAGGSCESLGAKLSLAPSSVYQRLNKLNNKLVEAGKPELPSLRMNQERKGRKQRLDLDKVADLIRAKRALDTVDAETETETEKSE